MTPAATIAQSQITGAPRERRPPRLARVGEKASRSATSGIPQAWTTRVTSGRSASGKRSIRTSRATVAKLSA
jgi:hypothetical protein